MIIFFGCWTDLESTNDWKRFSIQNVLQIQLTERGRYFQSLTPSYCVLNHWLGSWICWNTIWYTIGNLVKWLVSFYFNAYMLVCGKQNKGVCFAIIITTSPAVKAASLQGSTRHWAEAQFLRWNILSRVISLHINMWPAKCWSCKGNYQVSSL